jgi:hypothetical protein
MRLLILLFLCTGLTAVGADLPYPPDIRPELSYPSQDAIAAWAAKVSFGGAWTEVYKHDKQKIVVAFRCFSSGVNTTDLSFFVPDGDHWKLVLWYPVRGEAMKIEQQKEGLQITGFDYQQNKRVNRLFIPYDALSIVRG